MVAVVDAGVVLSHLDARRPGHVEAAALFARVARGEVALHVSLVNLAEVLTHARGYIQDIGADPVALVAGVGGSFAAPDVTTARLVATLADLPDASLADRFLVATAIQLGARIYTTDATLAAAVKARKGLPAVTLVPARRTRGRANHESTA